MNKLPDHHEVGDHVTLEDGKEYVITKVTEDKYHYEYANPIITKRQFLAGAVALVIGGPAAYEGLSHTDTEVGKAIRFRKTIGKIESIGESIAEEQQSFNADTAAVLSAPEAYTQKLSELKKKVDEITEEVKKINKDGIKINSGLVYQKQKKIQSAIARFNNENFSTVFQAAGLYMKGVGAVNKGIGAVRNKIIQLAPQVGSILGETLGTYATQFINKQVAENLKYQTGNITIAGVNVPLGSIAKLALAAQSLCTSLVKLQNELEELGDSSVEISNNDYINAFTPNPRDEFIKGCYKIAEMYLELELKKNKNYSEMDIKKVQKIMVKNGYLIQLGKENVVNGKYDKATKAALAKMITIFKNSDKFEKLYEEALQKGVKKPIVARGQEVHDVQDLIALAGYMRIKEIDKAYGPDTYRAYSLLDADYEKYEEENGLND